jgi:SAM-dependent MidA family methyltransferase
MTPLERLICDLIATDGPMRLDRYMSLCLNHPQHGYYVTRDPLGGEGDFITAPEVSQVFGELIGIWAAGLWMAMDKPPRMNLVELGPGRGTLMVDVLRTIRKVAPALADGLRLHLVETSPVLRARQRSVLTSGADWHMTLEEVPKGPMILLANEFFDAIPIRQYEMRGGLWYERVVGLENGHLAWGLTGPLSGPAGKEGDVVELAPAREAIARHIGERLAEDKGAALIIDYGHLTSAPGNTLQAMRSHGFTGVIGSPGECDLTSHVDFQELGHALEEGGGVVHPAMTQRAFLLAMGLEPRIEQLVAAANTDLREILMRQKARLADSDKMGNLFKVLAVTSPGIDTPYPFGKT